MGDFSVGTLPKHTQFPGSWVGTEHYLNPKAGKKIARHLPGRKSRVGGRDRTVNLDFGKNLGTIFALLLFFGGGSNP